MNWKAYFFFTKGERRGVIALLIVASLFLLIRVLLANKLEDSSVAYAEESSISSINIAENSVVGNAEGKFEDAGNRTFKRSSRPTRKSEKTDEIVEINSADTTTFKKLRGIGSGYARMIVNYREKLGGFYSSKQLLEVYKFPAETYEKIKNQLSVDTTLIRKINVNTATVKELKQHPYISYYQALSIVENRDLAPEMRYNSLYDMVVDEDLQKEDILRVAPYFSFK